MILVTAIWSALYLNKCMMCFGNTQVVPFYYCTFTTLSILGGGVVYKEFDVMTWQQGLMFGFGIVLAFSGVYLICANRKEAKEFNELPPEEKLGRIQSTGGLQPVGPLVGGTRRMTMNPRDVLEEATGLKVTLAEDPSTCVARGTAEYLENLEEFKDSMDGSGGA